MPIPCDLPLHAQTSAKQAHTRVHGWTYRVRVTVHRQDPNFVEAFAGASATLLIILLSFSLLLCSLLFRRCR